MKIYKILNNIKKKLKINITTKDPLKKQVIVPMSTNNFERVMNKSNAYIANINKLLKGVKSDISANYIHSDSKKIIIMTNKIAITLDLNIIEKYMKELDDVDTINVISPRLLQSKFYLKILDISYFVKDTNLPITLDIIESVIKSTYILNDIFLTSYPQVIKASPKSNMAVI